MILKHTNSATLLGCRDKDFNGKKINVSFSSFNEIQSISSNFSNMSVKSKSGTSRSKVKPSSKSIITGANAKREKTAKTEPAKTSASKAAEEAARIRSEESLRWEFAVEDEEQEMERIKVYKINRRKRYLAAAQAKGLGWVVNYGKNGFPLVDESVTDLRDTIHSTISDFSPVHKIMANPSNGPIGLGTEIAC